MNAAAGRFAMLRTNGMKRFIIFTLAALVFTAAGAVAQNNDYYIQLTRISMIEGNVGYQRVPDEEWAAAGVNMPLEPGDRIYTGRGGRVEIEFEEGSVLRLSENTDIEILTLDEDFVQIRMLLGIASITAEQGVDFEIGTPAAAFSTEANGIYRFEVAEDGRSEAIVRKGRLETVNNNFTRVTRNGELVRVYPDATGPEVTAHNRRDAWDEWTDRRDADRRPSSAARRYIPDNVSIGVSELDRHGRWVYVTNYGWGWVPYSVAGGWSPYSVGRWVYRPRFGWTWVSYETWGWLPYHYGRWYRDARYGWTWFPGESVTFRFWSPGLVVFYRGSGWVSWGPLGPGDYYDVSYYRYRRIYAVDLVRVRVLAVRQPGNYINQNVRGAFQTVSTDHFRGLLSSNQNLNARRNDITQPWRQGSLVRGGLDVSPARESFRPAPDRRAERPQSEANRTVVVRRTPTQVSGNDGRFRQTNNPDVSPAPDRGNNSGSGSQAGRRPDENRDRTVESRPAAARDNRPSERPDTGASSPPARENSAPATGGNSPGSRDRQTTPTPRSRPASEVPPARQDNSAAPSNDSVSGTRDQVTVPRSSPAQDNRPSERPGTGASSPPARENNAPATGGNSPGSRDRQTAPTPRSRSTSEAPATRQDSSSASANDAAGRTRDQATVSRPSAPQNNRQSERPGTGASSPPARENSAPSAGGGSSGSRIQQSAPAQRNQSISEAPSVRQNNNAGSSLRGSSPVQSAPRAGQQNEVRPSQGGSSPASRPGGRR